MDEKASLVAVVLAAGRGMRLRPLTALIPKPLCPVNNVPLIDLKLQSVTQIVPDVAVNLHYGRELLEEHLEGRGRAYLSIEEPEALGTAWQPVRSDRPELGVAFQRTYRAQMSQSGTRSSS